jgi:hypothetical protein
LDSDGARLYVSVLITLLFAIPTVALWRAKSLFRA